MRDTTTGFTVQRGSRRKITLTMNIFSSSSVNRPSSRPSDMLFGNKSDRMMNGTRYLTAVLGVRPAPDESFGRRTLSLAR